MSKSPSLRRIQADIRELALDPSDRYHASPMENDMFEWHFTIRGADGTEFEGGIYHGRILLPPDYPYKPPHIIFLNASGRFETNTKICLSFSAYHPELWQPAWGIRLILEALISFLPTPADGAIGALDWSAVERKRLAAKSVNWECPCCGKIANLLPKLKKGSESRDKANRFQKEIEHLQLLQQQEHKKEEEMEKAAKELLAAENDAPVETNDSNQDSSPNEREVNDEKQGGDGADHPSDGEGRKAEETKPGSSVSAGPTTPAASPTVQPKVPAAAARVTPPTSATVGEQERPAVTDDRNAEMQPLQQPLPLPPPPLARQNVQQQGTWFWDPLLQAIIVVLSMICYLLLRKVQAVWDELKALD